tara:strand:+ start:1086 stop:1829 length:744 start_codon:yes stop_codon:yes gene_type:complete
MLRDVLLDIVKHTHSLGFIQAVKIENTDEGTMVEAMDEERTVVLKGKLNNKLNEVPGLVGMGRLGVLSGYLNYEAYGKEGANIEVVTASRDGKDVAEEMKFTSPGGYTANYRFMVSSLIEEQLKTIKFKGVSWDVSIQPTAQNLKDLSYFNGIMGGFEPTFVAKTDGTTLKFYIGDGANDRVEIPFATNVEGKLTKGWAWPLAQVLSILKLSDTSKATMGFSDQGAMQIEIDSGIGKYEYILPARSQ